MSFSFPVASLQSSGELRVLVLSAGPHVRVVDATTGRVLACTSQLADATARPAGLVRCASVHADAVGGSIRVACVADDKRLHCYELQRGGGATGVLQLVGSRAFKRRLMVCAFVAPDSVAVADKFGDAFLCSWSADQLGRGAAVPEQDEFGAHFGTLSTVTALLPLPPALRRLAAANRDEQVFVVRVPDVHEITAFCLGHEAFVTALAHTAPALAAGATVLLSAGGDGSVRAWNAVSGAALAELQLRPDHVPLDVITGVEPTLPPAQLVRALAAFDVNVYFVTQDGRVHHVTLVADAAAAGALRFSTPPRVLVDAHATCVAAAPNGVWVAFDDGRVELRATADGALVTAVADAALPAESAAARDAALDAISPAHLMHKYDTRSKAGGAENDSGDEE